VLNLSKKLRADCFDHVGRDLGGEKSPDHGAQGTPNRHQHHDAARSLNVIRIESCDTVIHNVGHQVRQIEICRGLCNRQHQYKNQQRLVGF
jgi:hypothetical protein